MLRNRSGNERIIYAVYNVTDNIQPLGHHIYKRMIADITIDPALPAHLLKFVAGSEIYIVYSKRYGTPTVWNNIRFTARWDTTRGRWITVVTITPASSYSEYAVRVKATRFTTQYKRAVNDKVEIETNVFYAKDLDILARPIPLQSSEGANTGTPSPGREGTLPPVLDMPVSGEGQTNANGAITAESWSPLGNGETATAAALESEAGKNLDPSKFSGAVPVIVRVQDVGDPVTLIVFYDWNSTPTAALYYYGNTWHTAKVQNAQGGKFTVSFEQGFKGSVSLDALIEKTA